MSDEAPGIYGGDVTPEEAVRHLCRAVGTWPGDVTITRRAHRYWTVVVVYPGRGPVSCQRSGHRLIQAVNAVITARRTETGDVRGRDESRPRFIA